MEKKAAETEKFAFVVHPLTPQHILNYPKLRWLKIFPLRLIEWGAAFLPPLCVSSVTGAKSPTGVKLEGWLIGLGATPREMMRRKPEFIYKKLIKACKMAEKLGAKIIGLGAFTSVVGDAGITVAKGSNIAVTSGNSYSVSLPLEAAKILSKKLGLDPKNGKAVVIGAKGSIGSACVRVLAQVVPNIALVAPKMAKLINLQKKIESESSSKVTISTSADEVIGDADLIITATSAQGEKIIDIMKVKPGCVICDVARLPDIQEADAKKRPDVLVIESGEAEVPGAVDFHFDIRLPSKTAYACLSETMILAMEKKYENFSLGRDIDIDKVKEIYKLGKKHGFKLATIRSFGRMVTDQEIELIKEKTKRAIA
ncbi:MAG: hypothetical protein ACFFCW_05210 [Candidatus Hodarchaeota archaeon]